MCLPTPQIASLDELIKHIEQADKPFILRQTEFFQCSFEEFAALAQDQTTLLKGYSSSLTWDFAQLKATDVLHSWQRKTLRENIVDAPIDAQEKILPLRLQTYLRDKLGERYTHALCWVFTVAPKVTHFHTDPTYAGGWMKLLQGEKTWWLVGSEDFKYLTDRGHTVESLAEKELNEMLELENGYLQGKIYCDTIRAGDLLWFPINTLHKVITTKDSFGFGGYF